MNRRTWVPVFVVFLMALAALSRPALSQDTDADRIANLETRVAELEECIPNGTCSSPPTLSPQSFIDSITLAKDGRRHQIVSSGAFTPNQLIDLPAGSWWVQLSTVYSRTTSVSFRLSSPDEEVALFNEVVDQMIWVRDTAVVLSGGTYALLVDDGGGLDSWVLDFTPIEPIDPTATAEARKSFTLTGAITVGDPEGDSVITQGDAFCFTSGGYSDISVGAGVVVRDENDTIIATGSLDFPVSPMAGNCTFPFRVDNLPRADFYTIEVTHRGPITYSFDELESYDWFLSLSLGDALPILDYDFLTPTPYQTPSPTPTRESVDLIPITLTSKSMTTGSEVTLVPAHYKTLVTVRKIGLGPDPEVSLTLESPDRTVVIFAGTIDTSPWAYSGSFEITETTTFLVTLKGDIGKVSWEVDLSPSTASPEG